MPSPARVWPVRGGQPFLLHNWLKRTGRQNKTARAQALVCLGPCRPRLMEAYSPGEPEPESSPGAEGLTPRATGLPARDAK